MSNYFSNQEAKQLKALKSQVRRAQVQQIRSEKRYGNNGLNGYRNGASSSAKMIKKVKEELLEKKGADVIFSAIAFNSDMTTAGGVYLLNGLTQGSGFYQRIGRKVTFDSVRIKGYVNYSANLNDPINSIFGRILIIWDKQPQGALPVKNVPLGRTISDATGTTTSSMVDAINYVQMARFKILHDETIVLNPAVTSSAAVPANYMQPIDIYKKLGKSITTTYTTADPTIADIATGALYAVFLKDSAAPVVTVTATARVRYHE